VRQRKARPVIVTLGPRIGRRVIVRQGITAGDVIIVEGHHGLRSGAAVEQVSGIGADGGGKADRGAGRSGASTPKASGPQPPASQAR